MSSISDNSNDDSNDKYYEHDLYINSIFDESDVKIIEIQHLTNLLMYKLVNKNKNMIITGMDEFNEKISSFKNYIVNMIAYLDYI